MKSSHRPELFFHITAILILISCAVVQASNYYYLVSKPFFQERLDLHIQILNGTAPSPYLYRDLIPFIADLFFRLGSHLVSTRLAFSAAYLVLDIAGISLILISLYLYLSHWFTREFGLVGSLFCAAVIGITAHEHYFQPWSFWEAGFFILSLIAIIQKRMFLLGFLVALASLNRETALFIPLVFLVTTQDVNGIIRGKARIDWKNVAWFCLFAVIWLIVFLGLRLLLGFAVHVESIQQIMAANLDPKILWKTVLNILLFQGVFWIWAILGYRTAPQFIRRTVWIVPPFIILMALWAYWVEVRVLMPLYAISIPLGINYLRSKMKLHPSSFSST